MKKMPEIKINPSMLIIIFIIFTLILGLSLYSSYIAQKNAIIDLMVHSSIQLSKTIEKASRNTQIGYRLFINQFKSRMYTELKYISSQHASGRLTARQLKEFVDDKRYKDILLLDSHGKTILTTNTERPPFLEKKKLDLLLTGRRETIDFGINRLQGSSEKRLVAGISRKSGGAIIGTKQASKVLTVKNIINVNSLLTSIVADSTIKYIAIQDTGGIINSTTTDSLSAFSTDKMLHKSFTEKNFQWRIANHHNEKIIEAVNYISLLGNQHGVIRIGLDYSPIQKIQTDALRQASLRLLILVIVGFFMIGYSIVLQNNQLMEREKIRITEEITDLQNSLSQKEKLSAIGELAAGVAHKIRNPLNAISMTIQRLNSEFEVKEGHDEYNQLHTIVKKEIHHISEIINQFLQFSRPNKICKTDCNITEIIETVIKLYSVKTDRRNISLVLQKPDEKIVGNVDEDKIKQALINLLENAIDATDDGGEIKITIDYLQNNIVIKVMDTGHGIPAEDLPKIYNLYFTTKPEGTGIGLAQVYRIISEHDGKIYVDSIPGEGTTFILVLPKKEDE